MHLLQVVFVLSALLYSFYDAQWFSIFWKVVVGYFMLKMVFLSRNRYNTTRRMIQIATWGDPSTPYGHAVTTINVTKALQNLASLSVTGHKVTLTDVIAKAVAQAVGAIPDLQGNIAFGLFFRNSTVSVNLLLSNPAVEGENIITLNDLESKKLSEIAAVRVGRVEERIKQNSTPTQGFPAFYQYLPSSVLGLIVCIKDFFTSVSIGFGMTILPAKVLLTEVGYVGEMVALISPPPDFRGSLTICVSTITDEVVVDGKGAPAIAQVVKLGVNYDFRYFSDLRSLRFLQLIKDNVESAKVFRD